MEWPVFFSSLKGEERRSVYLLKTMTETYKIGFAVNVVKRLWEDTRSPIQRDCPMQIWPICEFRTPHYRYVERELHFRYKDKNWHFYSGSGGTEWFRIPGYSVERFIKECETIEKSISYATKDLRQEESYMRSYNADDVGGLIHITEDEFIEYKKEQRVSIFLP